MSPRHYLLLFAKYPYAGTAKTRLIPRLGQEGATEFARSALIDTLHLYAAKQGGLCQTHTLVWCYAADNQSTGKRDVEELLALEGLANKWLAWPQIESRDLGQRLAGAVKDANAHRQAQTPRCDSGFTTLIGADCVVLGPEHVSQAVSSAMKAGSALLPASDGGYVLLTIPLAMADHIVDEAFADIRWSCSLTAQDQISRLGSVVGQKPFLGTTLSDVDEPEDLDLLFHEINGNVQERMQKQYPRTLAVVQKLMKKNGPANGDI